jgi:hypothetical protein
MATATKLKLHTMLGNYPNTKALKNGRIRSDSIDFDFVEVKVANNLFKQVVRDAKYDVAELAIVTYLQAKAFRKPYVLLPAVIVSRSQHHTIAYNPDRGPLKPSDLNGKRVGVRAYTVTQGRGSVAFWPATTASTSIRWNGPRSRIRMSRSIAILRSSSVRRKASNLPRCCSMAKSLLA